jgi:hypothetical protein
MQGSCQLEIRRYPVEKATADVFACAFFLRSGRRPWQIPPKDGGNLPGNRRSMGVSTMKHGFREFDFIQMRMAYTAVLL